VTAMSDAARRILNVVALREGLPLDGWEHFYTAAGDDGATVFSYDRAHKDGAGWLHVISDADGVRVDWEQSRRPEAPPAPRLYELPIFGRMWAADARDVERP
jgi:hypothetical protein